MITIMIIMMMMIVLFITNSNNSSSCDISNNNNNDSENSDTGDNLLFSALFVRDWVSSFFMYGIFSLITRVIGLKS